MDIVSVMVAISLSRLGRRPRVGCTLGRGIDQRASCGDLLAGADLEHLRAAHRAGPLGSGSAILHRNLPGVLDLTLGLALHAVAGRCGRSHDYVPSEW